MDNIRLTNIFKVSQRLLLVLIFAATLVPAWKAQADAAPSPSSRILQENDAKTLRDGRSESTAAANTLEILAVSRPNKVYLPAITGPAGIKPRYFSLLPPGSKLPSDAACAAAIKRKPENKRVNKTYNATTGNGQRLKERKSLAAMIQKLLQILLLELQETSLERQTKFCSGPPVNGVSMKTWSGRRQPENPGGGKTSKAIGPPIRPPVLLGMDWVLMENQASALKVGGFFRTAINMKSLPGLGFKPRLLLMPIQHMPSGGYVMKAIPCG